MTYSHKWLLDAYRQDIKVELGFIKSWTKMIADNDFSPEELFIVRNQISRHKEYIADAERKIAIIQSEIALARKL